MTERPVEIRGAAGAVPVWRRDFPIDTPLDGYVARRDFTKYMGLTSLAFVVGQFWIALQNRWRKTRGRLPIVAVGRLDELANWSVQNIVEA